MIPIPDATRKRILRLDMHDISAREIAEATGIGRTTVEDVINRTRGKHRTAHRGNVTLVYDPTGIFAAGARFNADDIRSWIKFGEPAEGTMFEFIGHNRRRAEVRGGELVDISTGGAQ